ncbi:MAG: alginate export family protein [Flavobacteriaceae bacterium]
MKRIITTLILLITALNLQAQFQLDAEVRPRYEYRHGYKSLFPDNTDPANYISQRTRLNTGFVTDEYEIYISMQNVRVWGDVKTMNTSDKNGTMLYEAWGSFKLSEAWKVKLGRQEILFDDARIFGNVAWAQQARSHDAASLQYYENGITAKFFAAYNQSAENVVGNDLDPNNTYKALQTLWLNKKWEHISLSLMFLNNGMQAKDEVAGDFPTYYSQTFGFYTKGEQNNIKYAASAYSQLGKDQMDNQVNAYQFSADLDYMLPKAHVGLGFELMSGNDYGAPNGGENKAFSPYYGTNHKFNGLMDYFYVGNYFNNSGLLDLYFKGGVSLGEKSTLNAAVHYFQAAAEVDPMVDKGLGTELDITYKYVLNKAVNIQAGYSQMFALEGMEYVKDNFDNNSNNWGWIMVTFKPILFKN